MAPNIFLRAIAITGISLTANNSLQENWEANPINGSIDQHRLQELFGFAIRSQPSKARSFTSFKNELLNSGSEMSSSDENVKQKLSNTIRGFNFLPSLPDGPFAELDASCIGPNDFRRQGTLSLHWICFHGYTDGYDNSKSVTGEEVASLLVLWSIALPDFSFALDEPGASRAGGSSLVVSASSRR